jgi:hypothetical protein
MIWHSTTRTTSKVAYTRFIVAIFSASIPQGYLANVNGQVVTCTLLVLRGQGARWSDKIRKECKHGEAAKVFASKFSEA